MMRFNVYFLSLLLLSISLYLKFKLHDHKTDKYTRSITKYLDNELLFMIIKFCPKNLHLLVLNEVPKKLDLPSSCQKREIKLQNQSFSLTILLECVLIIKIIVSK